MVTRSAMRAFNFANGQIELFFNGQPLKNGDAPLSTSTPEWTKQRDALLKSRDAARKLLGEVTYP